MCKRCYICNRILTKNDPTDKKNYSQSHEEHIIPNAIGGHLKTHNILCSECGNAFKKEDNAFFKVFSSFIALLSQSETYRGRDRKDKLAAVKGNMFESKEMDTPAGVEVHYRDGVISSVKPFFEIDEERKVVDIFHKKKDFGTFESSILEKIKSKGLNIDDYTIARHYELSKDGILGLYFSKDKPDFNNDIKRGLAKIAVEFALDRGIARESLKEVLSINPESGRASIDYDNIRIVPFAAFNVADIIFENERQRYERSYPSHSLYLFTYNHEEGKALYCYIDLFSTFQYYVLLNSHYEGDDVCEQYGQRLLKEYKYSDEDVDMMDPSDLDLLIQERRLDRDEIYKAGSFGAQIECIKNMMRKQGPEFNLMEMKNSAYEAVFTDITNFLLNHTRDGITIPVSLSPSSEQVIKQFLVNLKYSETDLLLLYEHLKKHYRDLLMLKNKEGEMYIDAYVNECITNWNEHPELIHAYTISVFSKLSVFCYRLAGFDV